MPSIYVEAKSVQKIILATFPSYKRHKACVQAAESVTLNDLNWSGGTRAEYRAYDIETGQFSYALPPMGSEDDPRSWPDRLEGQSFLLPPGVIIVRGGSSGGKPAMLMLYVHPSNIDKLLETVKEVV
jgi:hypothetical protein